MNHKLPSGPVVIPVGEEPEGKLNSVTTPAAVIVDASRPEQQVWRGTLDQLAFGAPTIDGEGAGTIVIGNVVAIGLQESGIEHRESGMRDRILTSKF